MSKSTTVLFNDNDSFAENFWENAEKNGIKILLERMRGAKQTCERLRHAYEARAMLEEEYGKTMLHIAQKQKVSDTENGSSKRALDTVQNEFSIIAEIHLQLADLLRKNVAAPLSALINKQKAIRKDLQNSIQKLYNDRHIQIQLVRKAHKRHNMEIEKANLLVQQQTTDDEKLAVYKSAELTIDKLKKVYDEALGGLQEIVNHWNIEWRKTCEGFEILEKERLAFIKSNLIDCANLMVGCAENELQSYKTINAEASNIDSTKDLTDFVQGKRSTNIPPGVMDYVKMYAYQETLFDKREAKYTNKGHSDHTEKYDQNKAEELPTTSVAKIDSIETTQSLQKKEGTQYMVDETPKLSSNYMMVGVMEVYSGDDDEDDEESVYTTETESDVEAGQEIVMEGTEETHITHLMSSNQNDDKPLIQQIVNKESSFENEPNHKNENTKQQSKDSMKNSLTMDSRDSYEKVNGLMTANVNKSNENSQAVGSNDSADSPIVGDIQTDANSQTSDNDHELNQAMIRTTDVIDPTARLDRHSTISIDASQYNRSLQSSPSSTPPPLVEKEVGGEPESIESDDLDNCDAAAFELDDMLRKLGCKQIIRTEAGESPPKLRGPKPSGTTSSPLLQKQERLLNNTQQQQTLHGPQRLQSKFSSRRMSSIESTRPLSKYHLHTDSIRNSDENTLNLYYPFNSLSSKETNTSSTRRTASSDLEIENPTKSKSPPSAQTIHDRMLHQNNTDRKRLSYQNVSSSSSAASLVGSQKYADSKDRYSSEKFIKDFYSVSSRSSTSPNNSLSSKPSELDQHFIDFAYALYDYEATEEGEISFKEGDLLGIISKSEEGEQGWWEASLLNRRTRKVVCSGIIPSNFLETISK
ncbi:hypothetical protein BDF20DRAFT_872027 [Mycotypha africana]|uniref:uncharacterized protein n=1 Tax=Mycotypha africana TaxID=64632 RepID=UPI002300466C|nr:uncharacterized protein BDF20DRAFT_872027 [Mycotypha africana]KAI8979850.1 hypothetical protein BDF20DRAFT_872027 [Mycotypha africana]